MARAEGGARAIVCGLDESEGARKALHLAAGLCERLEYRLVLAHAVSVPAGIQASATGPIAPVIVTAADAAHQEIVGEGELFLARVAAQERLSAEVRAAVGSPADLLLAIADAERAELVAVGTHRRGAAAAAIRGSVAWALALNAPCPVLVVADSARVPTGRVPRTVVAGVGDDHGFSAVQAAAALARRLDARLVLVNVAPEPVAPGISAAPGAGERLRVAESRASERLLADAASAAEVDVDFERATRFGRPGRELAALGREISADLIVVGPRRRGPVLSAFLGSTFADLLPHAPCAVMSVPDHSRSRQRSGWFDRSSRSGRRVVHD